MKEGGFFMPINQNLFEEELDEFFNNLINSYLNYLSQEDETYKRLGKNKNSCIENFLKDFPNTCLLYTSPSPRDTERTRMPSSA